MDHKSALENRAAILEGVIEVFQKKGIRFTMDDVARQIKMSKKTIYVCFKDKEEMFLAMVDYLFDGIKKSEQTVISDPEMDTLTKIRTILSAMPDSYRNLDFGQLYEIRERYPVIYQKVEERLETGWENTIDLLRKGMEEGVVREVSLPIVKCMFESALEHFLQRDILVKNHITYQQGLTVVVDILVDGIAVR